MRLRRTLSAAAGLALVTIAVLHLDPLGRTGAPGTGTPAAAADLTGRSVVPVQGTGRIRVVPVPGPASGATGRTVRYTVEVEDGLGVDERTVASTVRTVLLDRRGQVNHEVGHGLGHGHQTCPRSGTAAVVMQQQTITLGGCQAWPWPTRP